MDYESKYPPRSDKARNDGQPKKEPKEIKTVTNDAMIKPVSKARSVASLFIKSDARSIGDNIMDDVVLPTINGMISEGLHSFIDQLFVGGRRTGSYRSGYRYDRVGYGYKEPDRGYSRVYRDDRDIEPPRRKYVRPGHIDNIVVNHRWEAQEIMDEIKSTIVEYDFVSVADVYKMIGKDSEWTSTNWGWRSIKDVYIQPLRGGGYEIVFPAPEKY